MSEPASISAGIAERYATAVFDLVKAGDGIPQLEEDLGVLDSALEQSNDLSALVSSPIYSRDQQQAAITRVAEQAGLSKTMTNTLGLMASNRRLFVLPQLIKALRDRVADYKGEVIAEVTSATPLTEAQTTSLSDTLRAKIGKTVTLKTTVDANLIGGLIVKVGSRMIDTSISSKLANLQNSMKEVG
ncbi:MAG: F0F1 ATP synthase subunit delta [Rhodobacteraceae bacterium]|nr:F0F1 ATP synthase subunit delta [Paracoccaceae bacterium]